MTLLSALSYLNLSYFKNSTEPNIQIVTSTSWNPDGMYLAVGTARPATNHSLYLLRTISATQLTIQNIIPDCSVFDVDWRNDGKWLASSLEEDLPEPRKTYLKLYSFDGSNLTEMISSQTTGILNLAWSPDGNYLAITNDDKLEINAFNGNPSNPQLTPLITDTTIGNISQLAWSPDGRNIAVEVITSEMLFATNIYSFDGTKITLEASIPWA